MVDYKELVRVLRQQADLYGCLLGTAVAIHLMKQAADAIEKLLLENDALGRSLCECDDLLKKLERPKWISVEERLPKKDQEVFVYLFSNVPYIAWVDGEGKWETNAFYVDVDYLPKQWMPLPEPPKEDA